MGDVGVDREVVEQVRTTAVTLTCRRLAFNLGNRILQKVAHVCFGDCVSSDIGVPRLNDQRIPNILVHPTIILIRDLRKSVL